MAVGGVCKPELPKRGVDLRGAVPRAGRPLRELVAHGLAREDRLGRLRQERLRAREGVLHAALLGSGDAGSERKQRRLAGAVAAHERAHFSLNEAKVKAAKHPVAVAVVAKPRLAHVDGGGALWRLSRGQRGQRPRFGELAQLHLVHAPLPHREGASGVLGHRLRRVRGHHDGDAKLTVRTEEKPQEGLLGYGVEHARRLIEQKQPRAHGERRREGKRLALAAGKLGGLRAEPRPHAEEIAGLGHAAAHLVGGDAEVLEAEGHLVPDGVAHDLVVGALEHVAHRSGRLRRREGPDVGTEGEDLARALARRRDLGLGEAQQGRFARACGACEQRERAVRNDERRTVEHWGHASGIGEREVTDLERGHGGASPRGLLSRQRHSSPLQRMRSATAAAAGSSISAA